MEQHATWLIDIPQLRNDLSVARAAKSDRSSRNGLRQLVEQVYRSPTESTKTYLSLIKSGVDDEEARQSALESAEGDLSSWFLVAMAPSLTPAGSIRGRSSVVPKVLQELGWVSSDADAILLGDPIADLARMIELPRIAAELEDANVKGWLSLERIRDLRIKLRAASQEVDKAIPMLVEASSGSWSKADAKAVTTLLLNDAERLLATADEADRPLRLVFDF